MHNEIGTKERATEGYLKFDIDQLVHAHALNGRNPGDVKHFYSNAQHACIASYLAEDIYGEEIARAVVAKICAERYTGYVSASILKTFPNLKKAHDAVCVPIFEGFGLDPALAHSEEVNHISRMMQALEYRDVRNDKITPIDLPEAPREVEIAHMSARKARTALTLRIKELFPSLEYNHENSLRESLMTQIILMSDEDR